MRPILVTKKNNVRILILLCCSKWSIAFYKINIYNLDVMKFTWRFHIYVGVNVAFSSCNVIKNQIYESQLSPCKQNKVYMCYVSTLVRLWRIQKVNFSWDVDNLFYTFLDASPPLINIYFHKSIMHENKLWLNFLFFLFFSSTLIHNSKFHRLYVS